MPPGILRTSQITTGETVRWEFDGSQRLAQRQVEQRELDALAEQRPRRTTRSSTRSTTPGTYTFLCEVHPDDDRLGHRRRRAGRRPRERPRLLRDRRLPARLDPAGDRRDPGPRDRERLLRRRDGGLRRLQRREPRAVRRRGLPLDHGRRARRRRSRPRSRSTSRPAAATSASTPRRTRSTRGRGTARCWAATSATTRPARPARRSRSRTATSPPRPASRPPGRASTSGTTTSLRWTPS